MSYAWHDLLGNLGVVTILGVYLLLQVGRLDPRKMAFPLSNAIGATLILVSLCFDFNLSAFLIELFWIVISSVGIFRAWKYHPSRNSS